MRGEVGRGEGRGVSVGESDCNWAAPARCSSLRPGTRATGATRMLAPQPLDPMRLASCQGLPRVRRSHAWRQVLPGARLFSGD